MEFFNKTRWVVLKVSDQVAIKPDTAFTLPLVISDTLSLTFPVSVTATLIKTSGRTRTQLTDVVTITKLSEGSYTAAATILAASWNGTDSLTLNLVIDGATIPVQLVVGQ